MNNQTNLGEFYAYLLNPVRPLWYMRWQQYLSICPYFAVPRSVWVFPHCAWPTRFHGFRCPRHGDRDTSLIHSQYPATWISGHYESLDQKSIHSRPPFPRSRMRSRFIPLLPLSLPRSSVVMPSSTRCLKTYLRLLVSFPSPPSIPRSTMVMHPSTRCLKTYTLVYLSHFRRWNVNTR